MMKTNEQIEEFVKSIDNYSIDDIKDFIEEIKNPAEDANAYTVLKYVEQMVLDCMDEVKNEEVWNDRAKNKLHAIVEGARAVVAIEEELSWR